MKILLVLNPVSGGNNKRPFVNQVRKLCREFAYDIQIVRTTGKNDLKTISEHIETFKPQRILAAGGDGTLQLVCECIMNTEIPMGIIPMGSANGMAEELGIASNPIEAFKNALLTQYILGMDLLRVNKKYVAMHIGDVGLNANIIKSYAKNNDRGMLAYAKHFLREMLITKPFEVEIEANNKTWSKTVLMVALCNARKFGTGVPLNNIGSPTDGKFEIVNLEKIDFTSLLSLGPGGLSDEFENKSESQVISTTQAKLKFKEPRTLQLDGEVIGDFEEIEVEIIPSSVKILARKS